jgi:hypothetical protein
MSPCSFSAVLKNIGPGGLKTAMSLLFSVNLLFTYAIMLAPPREYLERWIFKRPRVRRRVSSKALFSHNVTSSGGGNGNTTTGTTNSTTDAVNQQQGGEVKVPWWSERRSRRWRKNLFRAMLVLFTFGTWPGHKRGVCLECLREMLPQLQRIERNLVEISCVLAGMDISAGLKSVFLLVFSCVCDQAWHWVWVSSAC